MNGLQILISNGACGEAVAWATAYEGKPARQAWDECERADWLLWLAARLYVDRRLVVIAACACARTSLHFFEASNLDDKRPRVAIETAEAWTRGEATIEQVRAAADAAARRKAHARMAAIVREIIPWSTTQEAAWPKKDKET